jgi:hypothetical protein
LFSLRRFSHDDGAGIRLIWAAWALCNFNPSIQLPPFGAWIRGTKMDDFAAATAFTAMSIFIGAITGLIICVVSAVWVYRDAIQRGNPNAAVWAIGVFLLPILGMPLYLFQRTSANAFYVMPANGPATLCATCGKYAQVTAASAFCPLCGASRGVGA